MSLLDGLKSWPLAVLPHHLLSAVAHAVTRWRVGWLKNFLISAFVRHFGVDLSEAEYSRPAAYPDFNSFFTRALRPGVRPQPARTDAISCPVDGRICELGAIEQDRLYQAKGRSFSLTALLGGDSQRAAPFQGGRYICLYLSPRDYHRIHMPCQGRLQETVFIPGRLFSVAPFTTRAIPGLFVRNERQANFFTTPAGPLALVMVGAIFVASMETSWEGELRAAGSGIRCTDYGQPAGATVELQRGEEMGRFNMGSTVILLFGPGTVEWLPELVAGQPVRLGQPLGRIQTRA
jgi:phosphatidylserine decarboxylase